MSPKRRPPLKARTRLLAALVVVAAGVACDVPIDPTTPGAINIRVLPPAEPAVASAASPDSGAAASASTASETNAAVTLDSVRATARNSSGTVVGTVTTNQKNQAGDRFVVQINNVAPGSYSVTIEGFAGNQIVYFGIASGVTVSPGATATADIPNFAVFNPANLTATATASGTQINLGWSNVSNETGFRVERCQGAGCSSFAEISTPGVDVTTFQNTGLTPGTSYSYRVRAYNANSTSGYSNVATATTPAPPAAPTVLVATTISSSQVDLSWTDNATTEDGFRIESCSGGGCTNFTEIATVGPDVSAYQHTGLSAGTSYTYRVRSYNAVGNSAYSNEATASAVDVPNAPTVLTATTTSATQINLAWTDNSGNETGFEIERCSGAGCSLFTPLTTTAANANSYSNTGLSAGTSYSYRVRAVNGAGPSNYSNTATASTSVPSAPTTLVATTISGSRIDLSWTDASSDETGFSIERCDTPGCSTFVQIATVGTGISSYQNTGLALNTTYTYQVTAYNGAGSSAPSNSATANTNLPAAPTALVTTPMSPTQIDLGWSDNAANEQGYEIHRCDGAGCSVFAQIGTALANAQSYQDLTVSSGTSYTYRVRAYNVAGTSAFSNDATQATLTPVDPSGLTATTISGTQIDLAWTDNSNNEDGFNIEGCTGDGCSSFGLIANVGAGVQSYQHSSLAPGESFTYRVRAYNAFGPSSFTAAVTATTRTPTDPSGLTATTMSQTQIDLSWLDNSDNEQDFQIERCAGAACTPSGVLATVPAGQNTYQDLSVTAGNSYTYHVIARNVVGSSGASATATATTILPLAPSGLTVQTQSEFEIRLTWNDNASNEYGFRIERCQGGGCTNFVEIATTGEDVGIYNNSGLSPNTTYRYQVRAYNGSGNSAYTTIQQATTSPPAPTDLVATTASGTQINLSWTDNASNELGYVVEQCAGAGCSNFAAIFSTAADATTYDNTGLSTDEVYSYRVQTFNATGGSRYSNTATANTKLPTDPATLAATTVSGSEIGLTWADAGNETAVKVERCTGVGCSTFAEIASLPANQTSYQNTGLTLNESYSYRVRATNNVGASGYTNQSDANTLLPADPTGLAATTASATTVELNWTDNANNEFGFEIQRCAGAGCSSFTQVTTVGADAQDYADTGILAGEAYSYRLVAYNAAGSSGFSNAATATTITPAAPVSLTATAVTGTRIDLAWQDNADNELGFRIESCTGPGCSNFAEIATTGADAVTFENTGLGSNTFYSYRIRAYNAAGVSAYSNEVFFSTFAPPPPTALTATTTSGTSIDLAWSESVVNETGFRIERCTGAGCSSFAEIATVGQNVVAYADNSAALDNTYSYRVRAYNGVGASAYTATSTANTNLPADPTSLNATTSAADAITLTWNDASNNEAGFRIERCQGAGCSNYTEINTVPAGTSSYPDQGLPFDESFSYRVQAYNIPGNSAYTAAATASTALPAPSGLVANTFSINRVDLAWADNSNFEDGFAIEVCQGVGCSFTLLQNVPTNTTLFSHTGLAPATAFQYRIRGYNSAGNSVFSSIATASTQGPTAPNNLVASTVSPTRIDLAWDDVSDNENNFVVERCQGAGCGSFVDIVTLPPNTVAYQDEPLSPFTSYTYRIRAVNGLGNATSLDASATTDVPAIPSALVATTISAGQIDLSWQDNGSTEVTFRIERCTGAGCSSFVEIDNVAADVQDYSDFAVAIGNSYSYRVRSQNAAGTSAPSNTATATTFVSAAPSFLTATTASGTRIDLQWLDNSSDETSFGIERCDGPGCSSFTEIATAPAASVTFSDASALPLTSYTYRVRAYNVAGASSYSNDATANTFVPADPTSPVAKVISESEILIAWQDNADNETGYSIERCTGLSCSSFVEIDRVGADQTEYDDVGGISVGNSYTYRVRAFNVAGTSGYTPDFTGNTFLPDADPTGLTATTITGTRIDLAWSDNSTNERGFQIEACAGAGCSSFIEIARVAADVQAYANTGLTLNQTYSYRVRAFTNVGASGYTNAATANTLLPAAPTTLVATPSGTQVSLTWTDNATNETGYRVERCNGGALCLIFTEIATLGADANAYVNTGLAANSQYRYRVRAYNAAGNSGVSNAVVTATEPAAPTNLAMTSMTASSIALAWTDNASVETIQRLERCAGVGCSGFAVIASPAADQTSIGVLASPAGTSYSYRIRAQNAAGFSAYSNVITQATPTILTSGVQLTALTGAAGSETDYAIFVPAGTPELRIEMTVGSGDADMYVSYGSRPPREAPPAPSWTCGTATSSNPGAQNQCIPYTGAATEVVTISNPASGYYYVMLHGFSAYSNTTLRATSAVNATAGYSVDLGTDGNFTQNYLLGEAITLGDTVDVSTFGLLVGAVAGGETVKVAVYSDLAGAPNALMVQGTTALVSGVNEIALPKTRLLPGTYWLMANYNVTAHPRMNTSASNPIKYVALPYASPLPGTFPAAIGYTGNHVNYYLKGIRYP